MSGIYIKGMEMPTRCEDCFCYRHNAEYDYAYCNISSVNVLGHGNARLNNCPLIAVPDHGRLIDADAFIAEQRHLYCENCARRKGMKNGKMKFVYDIGDAPCRACGYGDVLDDIDDAPTIIPANKDGVE